MSENSERRKDSRWFKWLLSIFSATDDIPYTAEDFVAAARDSNNFKLIKFILGAFWTYLITVIILSIYVLNSSDTLFNVSVVSEKVQIRSYPGAQYPDWSLSKATIFDDDTVREFVFSGTISIGDNSRISLLRIGYGEAFVTIDSDDEHCATVFHSDDRSEKLGSSALIQLDIESGPVALPIDGIVTVGQTIREGVAPLPVLLSGNVTISDKTFISREYYLTEPKQLKSGDAFAIQKPTTQSSGFVRIHDQQGLSVSYNGKGKAGVITRYKSEPVYMKNSVWLKLSNDNTLTIFWILLLVFYTGAKIMIRLNLEAAN